MKLGIDRLVRESRFKSELRGKRLALLAHPASLTSSFVHSVDAIAACPELSLASAFGPQHGMRGDKQDNMVESEDYVDPVHKIPVFSLYGKVRRPTAEMMDTFDVLLVDLQDVGCRIYTFLTTLLYMMEACARSDKPIWVLDRPNPAGRPIEGSLLREGWESFVGCGPLPMRHGLTLGEAARWFEVHFKLGADLRVVEMENYRPDAPPGFGWPAGELSWVNPSPNASSLSMARCYAGTVLVEGTHLSEGRGTTKPLEMVGAPDLNMGDVLRKMHDIAPRWIDGCRLRPCTFEPTFHKHFGKLCSGFQIHVDDGAYVHHRFQPYRLIALWFKAIREVYPAYEIWRSFAYEYEKERLAIDLIDGGPRLREWVDDRTAGSEELDTLLRADEQAWAEERRSHLLYRD